MINSNLRRILFATASAAALSGCGADDIASPGEGGNITINNPAPTPTSSPTPTPTTALVTPASGCPTIADSQGLKDDGTIKGPTGEYRICTLPAQINASIRLTKIAGLLYKLPGRTDFGTDLGPAAVAGEAGLTLTIDPGVIVYAAPGATWLAINRGNKISAVGTPTQPIIFTSQDNIFGLNTDSSSGQWGGVVLLGRAPVTDCAAPGATPGTVACERQTEGAVNPSLYGGATTGDNSGTLDYLQIRYSGYVLSANNELQSLTTEGVGSATKIDHVMSFNSSDDGAEFFGGRVNVKHYISVGAEDDNIDSDTGVKANFQYVLVVQRPGIGDSIIEADTDNATSGNIPRQNTIVSNFTFIDQSPNTSSDLASILLRGETDYSLYNGVLVNKQANPCLRISTAQTASTTANAAIDELGAPVFKSVEFSGCAAQKYIGSSGVTDAQVAAIFNTGTHNNSDDFTSTLMNLYMDGAGELAVPVTDPSGLNAAGGAGGFFDTVDYIGAVRDANDTWYKSWTCNSSTADFGDNTGACTSLPTT